VTALRGGGASDVGRARSINQDSYLVGDSLFVVADGLGGHRAGEVASLTAVEAMKAVFTEPSLGSLIDAVQAANRAVKEKADDDPDLHGMATTVTAAALVMAEDEERLAVINVGDSRAYLLQRGELTQLSEDHSLVGELVREGMLTPEEAQVHPQRSVITRAIGLDPDVEIDSWQLLPYRGDRVLLCSDGLTNEVTDDAIAHVLREQLDPNVAARELIDQANEHGGHDNITVVIVDVVDDDDRAAAASAALNEKPASRRSRRRAQPEATRTDKGGGGTTAATSVPRARPRLTVRVVLFIVALVAVLGIAALAIGWYARATYYVALSPDHKQVVIYKGRPGGLLWFKPTVEKVTAVQYDSLNDAEKDRATSNHQTTTLAAATDYVARLSTTTTSTTTVTTLASTTPSSTTASSVP
jgi:protein phosphatase